MQRSTGDILRSNSGDTSTNSSSETNNDNSDTSKLPDNLNTAVAAADSTHSTSAVTPAVEIKLRDCEDNNNTMSAGTTSEGTISSSLHDEMNVGGTSSTAATVSTSNNLGSPTMSTSSTTAASNSLEAAGASNDVTGDSSTMSDTTNGTTQPNSSQDAEYIEKLGQVVGASKPEVAQSALKQISKLLQAISKKPSDKKARQLRLDAFILKKFVVDLPHGLALMKSLGFQEEKIDGKDFICLEEEKVDVALLDAAVEAMCDPSGAQKQLKDRHMQEQKAAEVAASQPVRREPCKTGCGYFGDPSRQGYCSMCFKTKAVSSASSSATAAGASSALTPVQPVVKRVRNVKQKWRYAFIVAKAMHRFNLGKRPVQLDKERCFECNRKLGLSGFECRCKYVFCGKHRYPQEHDCRFDHKKRHMAELARVNQRVVASKIEKIDE